VAAVLTRLAAISATTPFPPWTVAGAAPGQAEIDPLGGSQGTDQFILAYSSKVYYDREGFGGMALILNFNPGEDTVQLKGPKESYFLVLADAGLGAVRTDIYLDKSPLSQPEQLIAQLQGISDISLDIPYFIFL
jgi:hypothetical protein